MSPPGKFVVPAAASLLILFAGLSFWEMAGDSMTSDERVHLPAGLAYWKAGEFRLNPEHPPLVKLLCAAPLLLMDVTLPSVQPDPGLTYHKYQPRFGDRFYFSQDADRLLFWGRLPVLLLGVMLAVLLFRWSWELYGTAGAGLVTLSLTSLEPTILAHSHYITTDVALASFGTMALFFLWRFSRRARLADLLLAVLGMSLALASKYSAVFLLPVFLPLLWICWPATGLRIGESGRGGGGITTKLLALAGAVLVMVVIVQGTYFFSPDLSLYLKGIKAVKANQPADYPAYAYGRFFIGGVWWYPLYAYLLKTPLPTLAAIAIGVTALLKRSEIRRDGLLFLLLPAGVMTLAVCLLADNYGIRYLIPAAALLLVVAGGSFSVLSARRTGRIVGVALALWLAVTVGRASPHYISYFNELIGGPSNGPYFLHDSNIDWGQDLKRLARYQEEHHIPELVLAYWGPSQPEYYGIRYRPWNREETLASRPPPGVYAISVNHLVNLKKRVVFVGESPGLDWLDRFEPTGRAGNSILIYEFAASD